MGAGSVTTRAAGNIPTGFSVMLRKGGSGSVLSRGVGLYPEGAGNFPTGW